MCSITSAPRLGDTIKEEQDRPEEKEDQDQDDERLFIMSLHDVVHPPPQPPSPPSQPLPDQLSDPLLDDISSPISTQIFDFCDPDIFPDTLQNSKVTSNSNCCCYENPKPSYATNISFSSDVVNNDYNNNEFSSEPLDIKVFQNDQNANNSTTTSSSTTTATTMTIHNHHGLHHQSSGLSIIFDSSQDEIDNDISASIDFSPSPPFSTHHPLPYNHLNQTNINTQQDQYQLPLTHDVSISNNNGLPHYPTSVDHVALTLMAGPPPLGLPFEDDCLSPIPPFLRLNPNATASSSSSCSFLDPSIASFLPTGNLNLGIGGDNSGIFTGSLMMASELQAKELDFQGDNGRMFCPDQLPRVYNSGDMQAFSNESSKLVSGATSSGPTATEISSLDESSIKVGKLSVEQRKEKIHRYIKKRNERNFSKKIKYACRKTLADSRPRVRGRFAKNDDFGETHRHINGHHDDDDFDDVSLKEEDDLVDSSDIFAHISGVNSFKCNYQIQSWI